MEKDFVPEMVWMNPKDLTPYVNNAKVHSDEQVDKLAGIIAEFGFDQPIVVDNQHIIIKGHGRREAALRLNMDLVPVIIASHLDENQVKAARIADNKVSSMDYDKDKLKFDVGTLERVGFDLTLTGIGFDEMKDLMKTDDPTDPSNSKTTGSGTEVTSSLHLVMAKSEYEALMKDFGIIGEKLGQQNNYRIVRDLVDYYLANEVRS